MAQQAIEAAETYARDSSGGACPEKGDDQDSGADRRGDADEAKFSSLTAALLVRKRPASADAPAGTSAGVRKGQSGQTRPAAAAPGVLVRKGEASPSIPLPQDAPLSREQEDEEIGRLRAQCAALQINLTARETELARAQASAAEARELWRQEADEALTKAEAGWKSESARQLVAAEARWQEQYRKGLAEARAETGRQLAASETQWEEQLKKNLAELRAASQTARDQSDQTLNSLQDECAVLRAAIASRELEVQQLRTASQNERERTQREMRDALREADTAWRLEAARQCAETEARWREQSESALAEGHTRASALREQSERALANLREECASLRATIAGRELEMQQLDAAGKQDRERAQGELRELLAQAEAAWKAEAARQFAAAEAVWRERAETLLTEAKVQTKAVLEQTGELQQVRNECAALKTSLANYETVLARTRAEAQEERKRARAELEKALAEAESVWKANADRQLVAAEVRWQERYRDASGKETAEAVTAREAFERERGTLREALANCESKLEEVRRAAEEAQERARNELKDATVKADEAAARQLAAADAHWKEETRQAMARLQAEAETIRGEASRELLRLRQECTTAQQGLAEKDAELARLRSEGEGVRNDVEGHVKEALLQAEKSWKANEGSRLAAAETQWKKSIAHEIAAATARFETAERALAQLRIRNSARDASDNAEIKRLRDELAAIHANNSQRPPGSWEGEPVRAENTRVVLRTNRDWNNLAQSRGAGERKKSGGMLVTGILIAAAMVLYVSMDRFGVQLAVPDLSGIIASNMPQAVRSETPAPAEERTPAAMLSHGANLRAGPNMTAAVIASLPTGAEVAPVETSGNWTLVRVSGGRQGWVYSEFLQKTQDKTAAGKPPAATAKLR